MQFPFELRSEARFDAVGFGTNAVDHLIRVPEYPAFDSKLEISGYTREPGGEVASTMAGLQRLGFKTAYAGRFGSDEAGEFGRSSLVAEGVDITYSVVVEGARTQVGFIIIDEKSGERTVLWQRDAALSYSLSNAPLEAVKAARVLHMTPHDSSACMAMARSAKASGAIVSLDIDNVFDGFETLLPLVDVLTAAPEFVRVATGKNGEQAMAEITDRFGCPIVVLTLGGDGSICRCHGAVIRTPAFDIPGGCVDTTGAGDAFRAGLLCGMLSHATVEESLIMANAVAALKCRGSGARSALPVKQELTSFLKYL
jgi:sulfofructose kinase